MNEITELNITESNLRVFYIGSEPFFNEDWNKPVSSKDIKKRSNKDE